MDVKETLDGLVPNPEATPDWRAVLTDALPPRRRRVAFQLAVGGGVAVALLLLTLAPWRGSERFAGRIGVLEGASAALGDGTVVHLVLDEQWGGTVVDLETGKRELLIARREVWYDPARGLHEFSSLGDAIQSDELFGKNDVPAGRVKKYGLLLRLREALDSGEARVVGSGKIAGIPIDWISVSRGQFRGPDDVTRKWSQEVAVSKDTLKPVYFRETVDGKHYPSVSSRVLEAELLPAGDGDFSKKQRPDAYVGPIQGGDDNGTPLTTEEALQRLGGKGLWLGPSFQDAKADVRTFDLKWPGTEIKGLRALYGRIFIYETDRPNSTMEPAPVPYVPPEGKLFVVDVTGHGGVLQRNGIYVLLSAPSKELLLEAARALRPISDGSGAGG